MGSGEEQSRAKKDEAEAAAGDKSSTDQTIKAGDSESTENSDQPSGEVSEQPPVDSPDKETGVEVSEAEVLRSEVDSYKEKLLYLAAEHENFKKRMDKEKADLIKFGNERLLEELLVVIDSLELAIKAGNNTSSEESKAVVQGVELVLQQFLHALSQFGVQKIQAEGEKFNPEFHEAITQASAKEADLEPNSIVEIHQNGYLLHGRLLRPSRVVVAL